MVRNTPIDVSSLNGTYTALITPMKFDDPSGLFNSIDYTKFEQLIEDQIKAGVDGILVNGTTGQSPTLELPEVLHLAKRAVEIINKRVPLMVGAGSNATNRAVELTNSVENHIGPTTFLHVTGPYNKPTPAGLEAHFNAVAYHFIKQGSNIVLYDVPGRTSVPLPADLVCRLAKNERFIGIKYASNNLQRLGDIHDGTDRDTFNILSGEDGLVVKMMGDYGAVGVVSAAANVAPALFKEMTDLASTENLLGARDVQIRLLDLIDATFYKGTSNPEALSHMLGSAVRLPLTPLTFEFDKVNQGRAVDVLMGRYSSEELGINLADYRR